MWYSQIKCIDASIHWKHVWAFYVALLLCTTENKFNSERPKYDTLVCYFTCLQFDPTHLLCENLFLISKAAEKKKSKFVYLPGCLSGESGLDWHVGECIHIVCSYKMISFHIVSLSQNAIPKVVDLIFFTSVYK